MKNSFKMYIFTENIRKKFTIRIPRFSSTLFLNWIYLDVEKEIEHVLVKRRGKFLFWKYFLITKNRTLDHEPRRIQNEISRSDWVSYTQNTLVHVTKKRKKFQYRVDGKTFDIVYDRYLGPLKQFSVVTVTSVGDHDATLLPISLIVQAHSETSTLSGFTLIEYLFSKKQSS